MSYSSMNCYTIILQDDIVASLYQYSYKIIISPDLKQVYIVYSLALLTMMRPHTAEPLLEDTPELRTPNNHLKPLN